MIVDDPDVTRAALAIGGGRSSRLALRQPMIGEQFVTVLAAARTGAEWAWTNLYKQFAPAVLGYLRAQGAPEPEDLTAEVFFQVVKALGQFEGGEADFRSWVFVIAHRKLIDDSRHRGRRPVRSMTIEILDSFASRGNVEDEALDGLSEIDLRRLLAQLTSEQRDVLLLRILGGLTVPEVAAAMGRRPGAVHALQQRGLARLRKQMADPRESLNRPQ
jgi:RNA polymerase sigma-70 factor, ECF subfamily